MVMLTQCKGPVGKFCQVFEIDGRRVDADVSRVRHNEVVVVPDKPLLEREGAPPFWIRQVPYNIQVLENILCQEIKKNSSGHDIKAGVTV